MMRGYAIGLGAGTQVFTVAPWILVFGRTEAPVRAVLMGAGWLINLAVAEYLIRSASTSPERPAAAHGRRAPAVSASQPGRALPLDTGR